jgi:hypothetical protein
MHNPSNIQCVAGCIWKRIWGVAQGCNKTGQKDTNAMFVMMHDEIMHALAVEKKLLMQIQSLIIVCRKTIPTAFKSRQGVI